MKPILRLTLRRGNRAGPRVVLFPFMAVMICTMGALIPLLMIISTTARRQAEADARAEAAKLAAQQRAESQAQLEDVRWRLERLRGSRGKTEAQLADARLQLGHLEDHARRLRERLAALRREWSELDRLDDANSRRGTGDEEELQRLRRQIADARQRLEQVQRAAVGRQPRYAVVPYEGPNQTHRRPIYLECRADAVVLQPEGIELGEEDFEGPLGPGNPLAAALRAAREDLLAQRAFDPQAGEPYPLLLVRPDGINAYYAARAAMKSWGTEFGYELIGDDWQLAYQPPDERLAVTVRDALAAARAEQARLIAAAPRLYQQRPKTVYRATSSRGWFVRQEVLDGNDDGDGDYLPARPAGAFGGNRYSGGSAGGHTGASDGGDSGDAVAGGGGYGDAPRSAGASGGAHPLRSAAGDASASITSSAADQPPSGQSGAVARNGACPSGGSCPNQSKSGELPEDFVAGQPPRERTGEASGGTPLRPGEWQPRPDQPPPRKPDDKPPPDSLAAKRGADWGLRDAARGSTGIQRPIRVECYADRLSVISETNPANARHIPLGPRVADSIDTFVSAVWEQVESWGIAGQGMYWRPVLYVHVAPGGEQRFSELSALLEGSGLIVKRK
jgi:hypothetical protein